MGWVKSWKVVVFFRERAFGDLWEGGLGRVVEAGGRHACSRGTHATEKRGGVGGDSPEWVRMCEFQSALPFCIAKPATQNTSGEAVVSADMHCRQKGAAASR